MQHDSELVICIKRGKHDCELVICIKGDNMMPILSGTNLMMAMSASAKWMMMRLVEFFALIDGKMLELGYLLCNSDCC